MKKHNLLIILLLICYQNALAWHWQDLWWRPDEQAFRAFKKRDFTTAAERFDDARWRAAALYRSGQYPKAMQTLQKLKTPTDHYNRGNALAHMGQFDAAIDAYESALKLKPKFKDAKINLAILKKLKQKNKSKQKTKQKQTSKKPKPSETGASQPKLSKNQKPQTKPSNHKQKQTSKNSDNNRSKSSASKKGQNHKNRASAQAKQKAPNEQAQSQKQWLRRIPDNPKGLLRQKILRQHLKRHQVNT